MCVCVYTYVRVRRSLIYQRRWVKLDAEYLRYFDSETPKKFSNTG